MNRIREFDVSFIPHITGASPPAAPSRADRFSPRALRRKAAERIAALEPELTALTVIAPFVIAVLAALPTFAAA
jgi:hypothetical protein